MTFWVTFLHRVMTRLKFRRKSVIREICISGGFPCSFYFASSITGDGTSLNAGSGLSLGGRSSPVQQPQEERTNPPAMVARVRRILGVFIICRVWIVHVYEPDFLIRQAKWTRKKVRWNKPPHLWNMLLAHSPLTLQGYLQPAQAQLVHQAWKSKMHIDKDLQPQRLEW